MRSFGFIVLLVLLLTLARQDSYAQDTVVSLSSDTGGTTTVAIPDAITVLNQDNLDAYVFPKESKKGPQAWLIFIYAPWCHHCRGIMPQYINASLLLDAMRSEVPHAHFAVVNAEKNAKLVERFHVEHFPVIVYTTGKGTEWHRFDGGHSVDSFVQFASYLQRAVSAGSFADDVSDPKRFAEVAAESGVHRVPFYVYVPAVSSSTRANKRTSQWSTAIDGAASIGNVRFGVIFEAEMPPQAEWASDPTATAYATVAQAARECAAKGLGSGPGGEVLLSMSDRFSTPQCFNGEWLQRGKKDESQISSLLERYITVNGFRAVEELNGGLLSVLERQDMNLLGLIVVDGPLSQEDRDYLPVLRDMVQQSNEALHGRLLAGSSTEEALQAPTVSWAYVDGALYDFWRTRYRIGDTEMPAVLLVDPKRNRLFRARQFTPKLEELKRSVPWALRGPQQAQLQELVRIALSGEYYGEKLSAIGWLAERMSYVRGLSWIYSIVSHDDFTFVVVVFSIAFFSFLIVVGLVAEPLMERRDARKKKELEEQKKKNE